MFSSLYFQNLSKKEPTPLQEHLHGFHLPQSSFSHQMKWKQNSFSETKEMCKHFSFFYYSVPCFPFWSPCNPNPSWRAATTPGWEAGHHSIKMTSLPGTGFQLLILWPHNRNLCRWDLRMTSCVDLVGSLQVLRMGHYRTSFQKCPLTYSRTSQPRWTSLPDHVIWVPCIHRTVMSTHICEVSLWPQFHCFDFSLFSVCLIGVFV